LKPLCVSRDLLSQMSLILHHWVKSLLVFSIDIYIIKLWTSGSYIIASLKWPILYFQDPHSFIVRAVVTWYITSTLILFSFIWFPSFNIIDRDLIFSINYRRLWVLLELSHINYIGTLINYIDKFSGNDVYPLMTIFIVVPYCWGYLIWNHICIKLQAWLVL